MPIAINMSERIIDKLKPGEDRQISAKQADIYRKVLPSEIKIIDDIAQSPTEAPSEGATQEDEERTEEVEEGSEEVEEEETEETPDLEHYFEGI